MLPARIPRSNVLPNICRAPLPFTHGELILIGVRECCLISEASTLLQMSATSLSQPRMRSIFRTSATLITGTNVTTCFSHRDLLSRGFVVGSLFPKDRDRLFSSTVPTYGNLCSRFSLTAHHILVSQICSAR
jgi:hypothetical protein